MYTNKNVEKDENHKVKSAPRNVWPTVVHQIYAELPAHACTIKEKVKTETERSRSSQIRAPVRLVEGNSAYWFGGGGVLRLVVLALCLRA